MKYWIVCAPVVDMYVKTKAHIRQSVKAILRATL